jgi:hypothetical protein
VVCHTIEHTPNKQNKQKKKKSSVQGCSSGWDKKTKIIFFQGLMNEKLREEIIIKLPI